MRASEESQAWRLAAVRSTIANVFGGKTAPADYMAQPQEQSQVDDLAAKIRGIGLKYGRVNTEE